jgi:hypothetical protein
MGRVNLSCSQAELASVKLWEGSTYHALRLGWLLSSFGKGQLIMLSGWVGFCQVLGRVNLSCSQAELASAMWQEGSALCAHYVCLLMGRVSCSSQFGFGFCDVAGRPAIFALRLGLASQGKELW